MNLMPDAEYSGVNMNLWYGTGIHWCLANFYDPFLSRDPVESWRTWYRLQWEGGEVSADELKMFYDERPEQAGETYKVRGLRDIHPDPDPEEFEEFLALGVGMMEFYKEYALLFDDFTVIQPEHTFSIPLGFECIDPRDGEMKEVHYRGTQDAILQHNTSGRYGILEHKTAIRIDEAYHRKLEKDEQCTGYMWAAEREAEIHDLEYKKIDFVIYNALRKAYPKPPTPLKNGLFSVDRQKESTTYPLLMEYIEEKGIGPIVESDERLKNYIEYVKNQGYEQFIIRTLVTRNRAEIESCGDRIKMEASDMLGIYWKDQSVPLALPGMPMIYPNPTGDFICTTCSFRGPCIARDDGSDWEQMIEDNYVVNPTR